MAFFMLCLAVFVIFIQPEVIVPGLVGYPLLKISSILALIVYVFAGKKSQVSFFSNRINVYFLLFVCFQILSSCAFYIYEGIETFNLWLRIGIIYFLIVKSEINEKQIKTIVFIIVLSVVYISYYSISNYFTNFVPGMGAFSYGWYELTNDLALILVSTFPLALLLSNLAKSFLWRCLFIVISVMFAINIFFTSSRNGMLSLLIVGLLSLLSLKKMPAFFRLSIYCLLLGGILTVGLTNIKGRNDLRAEGRMIGDASSENRIEQWRAGLRMIKARPLLGFGRGQFHTEVNNYGGIRNLAPHNTLVQVFVETGIPGGIFFCLFSFCPFFETRKLIKKYKNNKKVNFNLLIFLNFFTIALLGFWICAFFGNRYNECIMYILVALVVKVKSNLPTYNLRNIIK